MDDVQLKTMEGLIENAAFMKASLLELQDLIKEHGYIEAYQNGENQSGLKESTPVRTYNAMIKNYNATIKSIISYLPASGEASGKDELLEFLKR